MPEENAKANLLLRVIAKTLDILIIAAVSELIPRVGYIGGVVYLLISDGLFDGKSLGKKIIKLKVISVSSGKSSSFRDSIIRNTTIVVALLLYKIPLIGWILSLAILTLEFLLMLGNKEGMRLGDILANTKVINEE